MKKIYSMFIILTFAFGFIGVVNAEEADLASVATITATVGGSDQEIIQVDNSGTYTYYYKYVKIGNSDFNTYVSSKYIMENSADSTDQYVTASSSVDEYEKTFYALIPTVSKASDLNDWTKSTNNEIKLSNLSYEKGKHNGYVLAVAATKNGDSKVYITRVILESKSSSTLGAITYNDSDKTAYTTSTRNSSNNANNNVNSGTDTKTESNPNTGLNDYMIYLVPLAIVLGSSILLRKNFAHN